MTFRKKLILDTDKRLEGKYVNDSYQPIRLKTYIGLDYL